MNNKRGKNTAASVRDGLLALARERGEDFQLLLTQYGLERLLYRLGHSQYRDRILKGAMLFILWGDQPHLPFFGVSHSNVLKRTENSVFSFSACKPSLFRAQS